MDTLCLSQPHLWATSPSAPSPGRSPAACRAFSLCHPTFCYGKYEFWDAMYVPCLPQWDSDLVQTCSAQFQSSLAYSQSCRELLPSVQGTARKPWIAPRVPRNLKRTSPFPRGILWVFRNIDYLWALCCFPLKHFSSWGNCCFCLINKRKRKRGSINYSDALYYPLCQYEFPPFFLFHGFPPSCAKHTVHRLLFEIL